MDDFETTPKQYLESVTVAFSNSGDPIDIGCKETDVDKYRALAREINSNKPITIVSGWTWWDLELNAEQLEAVISMGGLPVVLKITHVITDDRKRFDGDGWVRTSLLKQFHSPAVFETQNTFYILVGTGSRKLVPLSVLGFF